jgi:hypothetical protein
MATAAVAKDAEGKDPVNDNQPQIDIEVRLLEMPASAVKELFGKKGPVPGGDVTDDLQKRIAQMKEVDLLSAPRIVTRAGQSAQITIGHEYRYPTSFRVVETNGAWEPVFKTFQIGISATMFASPYPNDPERLHGAAEITLSRLNSVSEQTVTPPGQPGSIKLQSPVVESRSLTTSFDVNSGKMIILGGVESVDKGQVRNTVVMIRATAMSDTSVLVAALKSRIIPELVFKEAPFGEVVAALVREAKEANINIAVQSDKIVKTGDAVAFQNSAGVEPRVTLSMRSISLHDAIRLVAQVSGAVVTYDRNAVIMCLR